ncbi:dynactin p62 family-domain-containing protein [Coemansia spiralis]|nr:dynactin p62 family-domain-containing protein [Coemansia spiralis]
MPGTTKATVLYYCPCSGSTKTQNSSDEPKEKKKRTDEPSREDNQLARSIDSSLSNTDSTKAFEGSQSRPKTQEHRAMETEPPLSPSSNAKLDQQLLSLHASPIENLYYCDDCSEIRCARCVIEEPAGYHCPNCLFDVPTASVRSENNCCARNCFQCPVCTHVLSVVEGGSPQGGKLCFTLSCSVCFWSSSEIGWEFEKATGISAQVERIRAGESTNKEFTNLLDYWRTVQRVTATASAPQVQGGVTANSGVAAGGSGSFKHRLATAGLHSIGSGLHRASLGTGTNDIPEYRATCYTDSDHERVAELMAIQDADMVSYSGEPIVREPQRIRLHMKLARRCRLCHHILIKPESKAQATRFKIQLMAANVLPTITIPASLTPRSAGSSAQPVRLPKSPFQPGSTVPLAIRFSNPLYTEMQVRVDTCASSTDAHVDVVAPQFALQPFTELWEYDEEEEEGGTENNSSDTNLGGASRSTKSSRGILDRHGNRVAIQLNVTSLIETASLTIPLRITCTHVDDMDVDNDTRNEDGRSASSRHMITNSFWVYITLGD